MEKKQLELCREVLRRFHAHGLLKDFILVGSWAAYFYNEYFSGVTKAERITIKTRDIDFLISNPLGIKSEVDIPKLLEDLGFLIVFKGSEGYIKLDHPDLILEFLVAEKGKGEDKPVPLPRLGVNATALRFLNFLSDNVIKVKVDNLVIALPHPANFALHKLIIYQRRSRQEKADKDFNTAISVLNSLIAKGEVEIIKTVFYSISVKWQRKIIKGLEQRGEKDILGILKQISTNNKK